MNGTVALLIITILICSAVLGAFAVNRIFAPNASSPYSSDFPPPYSAGIPPTTSPGFKPSPTTTPASKNTFGVDQLYSMLKDTSADFGDHVGGVLVHMFTMQDAKNILGQTPFVIKANDSWVCDCSTSKNPSCSAWTYLRTDLLPMIFSTPSWLSPVPPMEGDDCPADPNLYGTGNSIDPIPFSGKVAPPPHPSRSRGESRFGNLLANADAKTYYSTPICGVMIDPNKMRQHITGMGAIDSATNERCCCSSDVFDRTYEVFFTNLSDGSSDGSLKMAKGIPNAKCSIEEGTAQCNGGDDEESVLCRRLLSGGSIHNNNLGGHIQWEPGQKNLLNDWGSALCAARSTPAPPPSNVYPKLDRSGNCRTCGYVQNCSVSDNLTPSQIQINPLPKKQWAPQYVDEKKREAGNIVGDDVSNFRNLFAPPVEGHGSLVMDNLIIGQNMCRFAPQDWSSWIKAIKMFYDSWRTAYSHNDLSGQLTLRTYYETMFTGNYQNYLLANAGYWYDFVENEVSMYFNANSQDGELQKLAEQQTKDFQSAIVGFFVVGGTCARHHKELDTTTSTFETNGASYTVENIATRCNLFFNLDLDKTDKGDIGVQIGDSRRAACEPKYIQTACNYMREMAARFNKTYRQNPGDQQVGMFTYTGNGSTYLNYGDLQELYKGKLSPDRYFVAMDCEKVPLDS
jgi:hypothetical protein